MTFEEVEEAAKCRARFGAAKVQGRTFPEERLCIFALSELYRRFYAHELSRDAAKPVKAEIQADFEAASRDRELHRAGLAQYQENIRNAATLWTEIVPFSRTCTDKELEDRLLNIISAMVGETVTAEAVRKARKEKACIELTSSKTEKQ